MKKEETVKNGLLCDRGTLKRRTRAPVQTQTTYTSTNDEQAHTKESGVHKTRVFIAHLRRDHAKEEVMARLTHRLISSAVLSK